MTSNEAIEKIKNLLFGKQSFGYMKTSEGVEMKVEGDVELEKEVYIITPDGEIPAPEGEFEMEDGMKIRVLEGKVSKIEYAETNDEEVEMEDHDEEEMKDHDDEEKMGEKEEKMVSAELIDGTIVESDGEALEVGAKLMVVTEEGKAEAPDGEHETTDGRIVEVEGGIIKEIEVKEEVELEEVEEEMSEDINLDEMLEVFTEGFNHLNNELNVIKEKYETLQASFSRFSAEPAGERKYINGYVEQMKSQRFSKLEQLAALKNKNKK